jgi:hypothetical protein
MAVVKARTWARWSSLRLAVSSARAAPAVMRSRVRSLFFQKP